MHKSLRLLSLLLFATGTLLGLLLFGSVVWGDLEASLFDTVMRGPEPVPGLRCPAIITLGEEGVVRTSFQNPFDQTTEFTFRAHISEGFVTLMREVTAQLSLEPGEKGTVEWAVSAEDAVYGGRLILVRVYQFAKYPLPARDSSCGILVLRSARFTGRQILIAALAISLLGMAGGIWLWVRANRPSSGPAQNATRAMLALAGCVVAGILVALAGWWMPGTIILVITLLLIGAIAGYFLNRSP